MASYSFRTDLALLTVRSENDAIVALNVGNDGSLTTDDPLLLTAEQQLKAYIAGELKHFDLPLFLKGTDFQRAVWEALLAIGYGETCCYQQVAAMVKRPAAQRAVGGAVGKNPIPIIIPCHRVIRKDGGIGGFGLGVELKRRLLAIEGAL